MRTECPKCYSNNIDTVCFFINCDTLLPPFREIPFTKALEAQIEELISKAQSLQEDIRLLNK